MKIEKESFRVTDDFASPYPDSIQFRRGEDVMIGREFKDDPAWKNWIRCTGEADQEAWCPRQFVDIDGEVGKFNRDYDAKELTVRRGETVVVSEKINGFGYAKNARNRVGWVPLKVLASR